MFKKETGLSFSEVSRCLTIGPLFKKSSIHLLFLSAFPFYCKSFVPIYCLKQGLLVEFHLFECHLC